MAGCRRGATLLAAAARFARRRRRAHPRKPTLFRCCAQAQHRPRCLCCLASLARSCLRAIFRGRRPTLPVAAARSAHDLSWSHMVPSDLLPDAHYANPSHLVGHAACTHLPCPCPLFSSVLYQALHTGTVCLAHDLSRLHPVANDVLPDAHHSNHFYPWCRLPGAGLCNVVQVL